MLKPARGHLYSQILVTNALRLLWVVVIVWGELGVFYWSLRSCRWPGFKNSQNSQGISHVLLLSDTQVQHPSLQTRGESWIDRFRRFLSDTYLKKSWHVTSRLNPDTVVFLGDMLANGRGAKDQERYFEAVEKFKSIFHTKHNVPVYYVPGNNDVWLGEITPYAKAVRGFYIDAFGEPSQTFTIQNHTFVILDAPGLVDEDYLRAGKNTPFAQWMPIPDGPIAFVKDIASNRDNEEARNPVILLSHIPLSRPEMANCGHLREKGTIRRNVGHGYQSMLGRQTTNFLLQTLKPLAVFRQVVRLTIILLESALTQFSSNSGDNRDYCEYNHTIADDKHSIREVTLKSFSPSVHIRRPGFQLLSVISPFSRDSLHQNTIADAPCFLPDQSQIYSTLYTPIALLTLLFLFALNYRKARSRSSSWRPKPIRASSTSSLTSARSVSGHSTPSYQPWSPTIRMPHSAKFSRPGTPTIPESPFAYAGTTSLEDEDEDPMQPAQYAVRRDSHRHYDDHDEEWSDLGRGSGGVAKDAEECDYDFIGADSGAGGSTLPAPAIAEPTPRSPRIFSQFISVPPPQSVKPSRQPAWTWSFVLAGRRRRITIQRPTYSGLKDLYELLKGTEHRRYRGNLFGATVMDAFNILWPSMLVWLLIVRYV